MLRSFHIGPMFLAVGFFFAQISAAANALNCSDLEERSDIYLLYGCGERLNAESIYQHFDHLSDSGKLFARWAYTVSGEQYPTRVEIADFVDRLLHKEAYELTGADLHFAIAISYRDPRVEPFLLQLDLTDRVSADPSLYAASLHLAFATEETSFIQMELIDVYRELRRSDIPLLKRDDLYRDLSSNPKVGINQAALDSLIELSERLPLALEDVAEHYVKLGNEELARETYQEASKTGLILAMESYAGILVEDLSDKQNQREREGALIFEELAYYGSEYSQDYLGWAYLNEVGVSKSEELGLMWRKRAALNGDADAIRFLVDLYVDKGEYLEAMPWALSLAQAGKVSVEDRGYKFAALLAKAVLTESEAKKAQEYLRFHCEQNYHVLDAAEVCGVGISSKYTEFQSMIDLATFDGDFAQLRPANSISLEPGNYKALIIANDEYVEWDKLRTPKADAEKIGALLTEKFGFDVEYVFNANRRDTLRAIYDSAKSLRFEDHLLVYYAGHGIVDRATDTAYWVPPDASRDFQPDWISADEVMTSLKSVPARHLLLVADSCYSGKLLRSSAQVAGDITNATLERLFQKKARVAITSGGNEPVEDSSADGKHSVFANALIKELKDMQEISAASSIFTRVLGKVSLEASQTPQYADMRELGHDGGDFIFIPNS